MLVNASKKISLLISGLNTLSKATSIIPGKKIITFFSNLLNKIIPRKTIKVNGKKDRYINRFIIKFLCLFFDIRSITRFRYFDEFIRKFFDLSDSEFVKENIE